MGRVETKLEDDLEAKLRMKALTKFGGKKGSLALALIEAIEQYVGEDTGALLAKTIIDKGAPKRARERAAEALAETGYGFPILAKIVANEPDEEAREIASRELVVAQDRELYHQNRRRLDPQRLAEERIRAEAAVRSRQADARASRADGSGQSTRPSTTLEPKARKPTSPPSA
jgi:hypothetical protein